ncbi:hypothetical protein PLEOSDRAFT_1108099 [Pleurotus ostreatus PC15]|uniref:Uncharacterized protein n=1 Tax=Pleurotus ostreatus (strain PC15) TaxID=1137138 RepID=A0A067N9G5_PLEO1|nr:hypothetical protein PLEOSDRAFT_1108099 [Pleurotus ostreatus PC15]
MKSFTSTAFAMTMIALFSGAVIAMPQMGGPLPNGMSGGMMPGQGQPQGMPKYVIHHPFSPFERAVDGAFGTSQPMQQGQQFPQNPQMQNPGQMQGLPQPMANDPNNAAIQPQNGVQLPPGAMPTNQQQQQFGMNPGLNTQMNGAAARGARRQGVAVIGAAAVGAVVALMI